MLEWIRTNEWLVFLLAVASLLAFVGSLVITPAILIRLPADYFVESNRPTSDFARMHPVLRVAIFIARNIGAMIFFVAGLAMLVLPGQGILTLIVAFVLLDVPGKYVVERWLVHRRSILRSINWLRRRAKKQPLEISD